MTRPAPSISNTEENEFLAIGKPPQTILTRLTMNLALVYLVSVVVIGLVLYVVTNNQVYGEARANLNTLTNMISSIRTFVREENTSVLIKQGIWHPSAVSPVVSAKGVAARFRAKEPDKLIRIVSDVPMNAENLPNPLEKEVMETFRAAKSDAPTSLNLQGQIGGQQYLIHATPEIVTKACLACHGSIETAPPSISSRFIGPSGYNWTVGQVVGASVIGVPVSNVQNITLNRTLSVVLLLTAMFVFIWLVIRSLLERSVIIPIRSITQAIANLSVGRPGTFPKVKDHDEINELVQAGQRIARAIRVITRK
jgi:two-component system, NtrC family, sensor kinase